MLEPEEFFYPVAIDNDDISDEIKPLMGDVLGNAMPDITGPSLPLPTKPKLIP